MVRSIGPCLLDVLADGIHHHSCIRFGGCGGCGREDAIDVLDALKRCLRLCMSIMSLLAVRLSPSHGGTGGTMRALHNAA
jgi:hypothetical protein